MRKLPWLYKCVRTQESVQVGEKTADEFNRWLSSVKSDELVCPICRDRHPIVPEDYSLGTADAG